MALQYLFEKKDNSLQMGTFLGNSLRFIVNEKGQDIYRETDTLEKMLLEKGNQPDEVSMVKQVLEKSTFLRYLDKIEEEILALDINNIIQSMRESEIPQIKVKRLVDDLFFGLGMTVLCPQSYYHDSQKIIDELAISEKPNTVPGSEEKIKEINSRVRSTGTIEEEYLMQLRELCNQNVPAALKLMGKLQASGIGMKEDLKQAKQYLSRAARMGDDEAISLLADCCYVEEKYDEAFNLYTIPGTAAITGTKRDVLRGMYAIDSYSKTVLVRWIILFCVVEAIMFTVCRVSDITGNHLVMQILCSIANVVILADAIVRIKLQKITDLRRYGVAFAGVAFCYLFCFIMF